MKIRTLAAIVAAAAAASLLPAAASAKVLKWVTSTDYVQLTAYQSIPIDGANTKVSFKVGDTAPKRIVIAFSAECAVSGSSDGKADIEINLNGATLNPTNGDDVFCRANGTPVADGYVRGSLVVSAKAKTGTNLITVRAHRNGGDGDVYLDDVSLVVYR